LRRTLSPEAEGRFDPPFVDAHRHELAAASQVIEMKTIFFADCLGVFQGGGPRAAAFAGAYEVAYEAGVRFSQVAGTSAGAIVAALIGAGAAPAFLRDTLQTLDFVGLLRPPENEGSFNGFALKAVGAVALGAGIVSQAAGRFGRVLYSGGLYSSRGLEEWLDEKLRELLKRDGPVLFSDLRLPTHVVATDFGRQRARLWSSEATPDTKVAFAVRASSSIPFFFQAVVEGENRLVDGGILSNLPTFVFAREQQQSGKRILTFRLQGEPSPAADWSMPQLIKRLVDTAISGASEIQLGLQRDVSNIDIPTGDIGATDFDRIDDRARTMLYENGQTAARRFIETEASRLGPSLAADSQFWDEDRFYLEIVRQSGRPAEEIILAQRDTDWYWQLFPTVLHWRLNGTRVRVLLLHAGGDTRTVARERTRRRNLAGLGVEVQETDELPFAAFLFRRDDQFASTAIVQSGGGNVHEPIAALYSGDVHQPAIRAIRERLSAAFGEPSSDVAPPPVIEKFSAAGLCDRLKKGVSQYADAGVTLAVEPVGVGASRTITKFVRAYKYEQMQRLIDALKQRGFELFEPTAVVLASGERSVIVPPVFEIHNTEYIGVEGNTRTCFAYRNGVDSIVAVVVRGVTERPPGSSVSTRETAVVAETLPRDERMPGFDYPRFRRIEGACRPLDAVLPKSVTAKA